MNLRPESKGLPVPTDHEIADGEELPFDGLRALHTPGHTAGHLALLLPRDGGVLFVGDAASNMVHAGLSPLNEDLEGSRRSLERLAALDFEIACFSHGRPLRHGASQAFRDLVAGFRPWRPRRAGRAPGHASRYRDSARSTSARSAARAVTPPTRRARARSGTP